MRSKVRMVSLVGIVALATIMHHEPTAFSEDRNMLGNLIEQLKSQDEETREKAAEAMVAMKDVRAVEPLIVALRDQSARVRYWAVIALGNVRDHRAVQPLTEALKDKASTVRTMAAYALGEIGDPRAAPALIIALRDEDSHVRRYAAQALGDVRDSRGVEPLIDSLKDQNIWVRSNATYSLGKIKDARALEALTRVLKDKEARVRKAAAWALGHINDPNAVASLIDALRDVDVEQGVREEAMGGLDKIAPSWRSSEAALNASRKFIMSLKDCNGDVRFGAEKALSIIDPDWRNTESATKAMSQFTDLLRDVDPPTRAGAAYGLGRLGNRQGFTPLIPLLKDKTADVRLAAASALADFAFRGIKDERAFKALIATLTDENSEVRRKAEFALDEMDGQWPKTGEASGHVPDWIAALRHQKPGVRRGAANALLRVGDRRGEEALTRAVREKDLSVVAEAYVFFIRLGLPGSQVVLTECLQKYGDRLVALAFINSGSEELSEAGRKWARMHGHQIYRQPGSNSWVKWGSKR